MLLRVVHTNGDIVRDIPDPVLHCTIAHVSGDGSRPSPRRSVRKNRIFCSRWKYLEYISFLKLFGSSFAKYNKMEGLAEEIKENLKMGRSNILITAITFTGGSRERVSGPNFKKGT